MQMAYPKKFSSSSHSLSSTLCFPHSLLCIGLLSAPHSSMAMRASHRLLLSSSPTFFTQPLLRVSKVRSVPSLPFRRETILHCHLDAGRATGEELTVERVVEEDEDDPVRGGETCLYSVSSLPLMALAALPGGGVVKSAFEPFIELVRSWNLPDWLVHWGHPGNMAVVLFAMGGYGTYLGFRIRYSEDVEEKAKAKDLHPKLLGGMFFFFALGATGGITSLLTYDKPILESPHGVIGLIGLLLLSIQTILPALFEGNPGLRNVHGVLGSGIMTLFLIQAALGLQLGLSF